MTQVDTTTVKYATLASGVRLPYVEQGDSDGVPVVLLHGVTDSLRSWEPVLPYLPSSIRAFAVTQRGHGDADRPAAGYHPRDFAADVVAFLDAVGIERAVLAGHSMSSYIAERVASEHPERVLGVVLVGGFTSYSRESCRRRDLRGGRGLRRQRRPRVRARVPGGHDRAAGRRRSRRHGREREPEAARARVARQLRGLAGRSTGPSSSRASPLPPSSSGATRTSSLHAPTRMRSPKASPAPSCSSTRVPATRCTGKSPNASLPT